MNDSKPKLKPALAQIATASILALLAIPLLAVSPSLASEGESCPNQPLRQESNVNPATGQPYDDGLPECRAYEMVSPLEKQAHDAAPFQAYGYLAAPGGEAVGYISEGGFAEPGNFRVNLTPANPYLSRRTDTGWSTESAFAPAALVASPFLDGLVGTDFSDNLTGAASCGVAPATNNSGTGPDYACASRDAGGSWTATPSYPTSNGAASSGSTLGYLGASADLTHLFLAPEFALLPSAEIHTGTASGLYEINGVGSSHTELRLANVDDEGNELLALIDREERPVLGSEAPGTLQSAPGSSYHAISESGETVFFGATPPGGEQTLYARQHAAETVALSNPTPSECTTAPYCTTTEPAIYQGASANGEKVFFTTAQELVNGDTDKTTDLYEYDFDAPSGHNLTQLSRGGTGDPTPGVGADVQGVVRNSADGSHVYFIATGVLTSEANGLGQSPLAGADNLYGVDTQSGIVKFVGELCSGSDASGSAADASCPTSSSDSALWGVGEKAAGGGFCKASSVGCDSTSREAQLTPDGAYLVFSTFAELSSEDRNQAQAAYRYDFQSGEVTWISHDATGYDAEPQGRSALITPLPGSEDGADADIDDWNTAISEDGQQIVFTTAEQLQADDANGGSNASNCAPRSFGSVPGLAKGCDVYEWHDGEVSMISDGQNPDGAGAPVISAAGSDIFFFTHTQLVGQDTDTLQDLYDARLDGGFPAPTSSTCSGEACQGSQSPAPSFAAPGSSASTGGGNLTPGTVTFPAGKSGVAAFTARAAKLVRGDVVRITAIASARGRITVSGAGFKGTAKNVSKAGTYTLKVALTTKERRRLQKKHKLKLKLRVAFAPASGTATSRRVGVTVQRPSARRRS